MVDLQEMGKRAKAAARSLLTAGARKNAALLAAADAIEQGAAEILDANALDLQNADGLSQAFRDRLMLTPERIRGMAEGIRKVAAQTDPIGEVVDGRTLPNGLQLKKVRVPLGVIGIIFEARPNVTADAAALCLKAGNAVILRGGKEAFRSNCCITGLIRGALESAGLPADAVQIVEDTSRESAVAMMELTEYLDVLIPRGGGGLIRSVVAHSRVPVIQTGEGNCHIYVDATANIDMAAEIVYNAKTSRPSVCNAMETLLVHQGIAEKALPAIAARLSEKSVEIRGCDRTRNILPQAVPATEKDWETEFLDYILAVKVVDSVDEAIAHIAQYSTGHSEAIITESYASAEKFTAEVDSAAVYVNASTRFTDGGEFGLGAEVGISTQKLHARGPMGVGELTSTKFIVCGNGQTR
ncbi:glutamate-5-semialdehyde dehydrogenase [Yeguia hominis]|uniref:Gamma-glutamyl phosphate reductase n=1 Tax=Yeguia hominis TaxID=2763662 RepID=A0A926HRQ3_9FIRM|nr:glutamate-5-semialdehyde dehydrogenase [Yeguia hominis]MBC8534019.1 glutamate-5-semialdehyde dehydrogenase [Yeguia hominis]